MKTQPVHIRRGLSLYKQPNSPNYYVRVFMPTGGKCLHVKTTGTSDVTAARRFAEDYYADCLLRRRYGEAALPNKAGKATQPHYRFDLVAQELLKRKKAEAGSDKRKLRGWSDAKKLIEAPNGLSAFFKRTDVSTIGTDEAREYLCFAAEHSKKGELASTTQRNHLSVLSGILKFAFEKRMIAAVPGMPKIRLKDHPRPCFTELEFRELCLTAGALKRGAQMRGDDSAAAQWEELELFLTFMIATFLRAGEWKELRQRHCEIVYGDFPYLKVAVPNGKTHKRMVVSMPEAISVYERIIDRDGTDPERFLFKNQYWNRDTAQERMRDSFEAVLKETGLALDHLGNKRTIYSLRHTSLMFRLLYGENVNLLMLARNAGTSVDQLERFYLSHADPAMKVENLHSLKPVPKPVEHWPEFQEAQIDVRSGLLEPELT